MMPSKGGKRSKSVERGKNESIVSGLPAPVLQGVNLSSLNENVSTSTTSFHVQYDIESNSSSQDLSLLIKDDIVEEPIPSKPEAEPLGCFLSAVTEDPGKLMVSLCHSLWFAACSRDVSKCFKPCRNER